MLSAAVARDMDLPIVTSNRDLEINIQGHAIREYTTVPSIVMGRAQFKDARFAVLPDDDPLILNGKVQGLLGPDMLGNFDVDLDFAHSEVHLFDRNHCVGKIPYWAPYYASAPFEFDGNGHILVDMTLDGKAVAVGIDTGAPTSVMSLSVAQRLFGLGPESAGVEAVGALGGSSDQSQKIYSHRFASLVIDGLEVKYPLVALIPDNIADESRGRAHLPDVILGLRELATLHLYIAYKEKTLYFTAANAEYPGTEEARAEVAKALAKSQATGQAVTVHGTVLKSGP